MEVIRNFLARKGSCKYLRPMLRCLVFCCVLVIWHAQASADMVWMKNGDKLTGQLKSLKDGKLGLQSSYGGVLYLDWDQVKKIDGPTDIPAENSAMHEEYLVRLVNYESINDIDGANIATQTVAINETGPVAANVEQLELESQEQDAELDKPTFWGTSDWKGNLDLSLNDKTASKHTADYSAKLNTKWRSGEWRNSIDADYSRKSTDSRVTTNNYGGRLSSNRFLSEKWFWQGRGLYKWDQVEDVRRQVALGTGPGYQFWEDETGSFWVAGLISRVHYEYRDNNKENFYAASINWDYSRYLNDDRLELYTSGEIMRPLSNVAELSIDAAVGLRYKMTDWLSWFMSYSRSRINGGRRDIDERIFSTGLGLYW